MSQFTFEESAKLIQRKFAEVTANVGVAGTVCEALEELGAIAAASAGLEHTAYGATMHLGKLLRSIPDAAVGRRCVELLEIMLATVPPNGMPESEPHSIHPTAS